MRAGGGCQAKHIPKPNADPAWFIPAADNFVVAQSGYRQTAGLCTRCGNLYEPVCPGRVCFAGMYSGELLVPSKARFLGRLRLQRHPAPAAARPPPLAPCASVVAACLAGGARAATRRHGRAGTASRSTRVLLCAQDDLCIPKPGQLGCGTEGKPPCPVTVVDELGTLVLLYKPPPGEVTWHISASLGELAKQGDSSGCIFRCAVAPPRTRPPPQ